MYLIQVVLVVEHHGQDHCYVVFSSDFSCVHTIYVPDKLCILLVMILPIGSYLCSLL